MKTLQLLVEELGRHAVAAAVLLSSLAWAQESPAHGRGHPPRPPPEALAACEGKSAGQACSFSHDSHALTGTCFAPEGKPLACKPDRPPPGGEGGPGNQ